MFELYEIWAEDDIGHQELIDTTKSRTEAFKIAERCVNEDGYAECIVFQENEDGDAIIIKKFQKKPS